MIAQPWLILGACLAFVASLGGAYLKGRSDGRAVEIARRVTIEEVARAASEAAARSAAEAIAKITINHTTIRQRAETITREVPVYRDCRNAPDVVELLDAARSNRSADGSADGSVLPGAGTGQPP